ncbi:MULTISPECIES: GNAT family N-acetyltransferase [unclassified Mesorhizobium]|uniref:GNAT family N-acetyltransferase n=1 Tax=unclassified Mesorhizobium TaxID=325217 RepID=UPI001FE0A908|nr:MULTISPECIES: GNAT family N-acetyltransferase [unclassified Mesorhizobium]
MNIRSAQERDAQAVTDIEAVAFETDWTGYAGLESSISNGDVLVAEVDDRVVGFCVILCRQGKSTASLKTIAVSPSVAGRGFGTALLNAAEKEVFLRGYRLLRLEVRADNHRAIRFYLRAGFRRTGFKPNYYADGIAAIRMHKRIAGWDWLPGRILEWITFAIARTLRRPR